MLSLDKSATNFRENSAQAQPQGKWPLGGFEPEELLLSVHQNDAAKLQMFETGNRRPDLTLKQNQAICVPVVSYLHALLHYSLARTLCIVFSCMYKLRIE